MANDGRRTAPAAVACELGPTLARGGGSRGEAAVAVAVLGALVIS